MSFIAKVSFPQSLVVVKSQIVRPSQDCNHINISLTLVFKTFKYKILKHLLFGQMKEESCVQSLLHRDPYFPWRRSPWSFRACLPCHGSPRWYPGDVLSPNGWGSAEKRGCGSWVGCVQGMYLHSLPAWPRHPSVQRGWQCRLLHREHRLCPCRGWCRARCSRFPVGVSSRPATVQAVQEYDRPYGEKKVLIVWVFHLFSFFLLAIW